MPVETTNIRSSAAADGDVAFTIDSKTGEVRTIKAVVENFADLPTVFDVDEFRRHYGCQLPTTIDILDIGYICVDGTRVTPEADFRAESSQARYLEAMQHLHTLVTAIAAPASAPPAVPGLQEKPLVAAHRHAREFLARTGYDPEEAK